MNGGPGNDFMRGGNGNDFLNQTTGNAIGFGGDGDDTMRAGNDSDTFYGGAGVDLMDYLFDGSGVTVSLSTGTATAAFGNDVIGADVEGATGTAFADTMYGRFDDNLFRGNHNTRPD